MVRGDLVLFEDEVNPVMSAALDKGLEMTALLDYFLFDRSRVMFRHIGGNGAAEVMASAVRKALDTVRAARSGISIVAIHNHMISEEPQFLFLHFWAKGPAAALAKALKAAMDTQRN